MKNAELFKRNYGVRICLFVLAMMLFVGSAGAQTPNLSGEINLAQGKTATAGHTEDGHSAAEAVDGNLNTNWSGNVSGHLNDNYWQVDLNSETFNTIRIQYNNQAPREAKLQYSNDNSTWTDIMTVGSNSGYAADNQTFVYKFTAKTARYVRIQCVEGGDYGMGFKEFEVYNSTYKLTSVAVDKTTIPSRATSTLNFWAYDQFGSDYTDYKLTSDGVGTAVNETNITTNPHTFSITTGALTGDVTLTATDKTDNTIQKTLTLTVPATVLTRIAYLNPANEHDFLALGESVELQPVDQFGNLVTGTTNKIVINGVESDAPMSGTTIQYVVPNDFTASQVTFKATIGETTVTMTKYVLSSSLPVPGRPTDIYFPVFSNGETDYNSTVVWQGDWDESATTSLGVLTLNNGQMLKPIRNCGSLAIANTKSPFSAELGGAISIDPQNLNFKNLHLKLFAAQNVTGHIYNEGNKLADFELTAGSWKYVTVDVSSMTSLKTVKVKLDAINGVYPDVLVANVYFTENKVDNDLPYFTSEPTITRAKTSVDIAVDATDATSNNLHYIVTDASDKEWLYDIKPKGATTLHIAGLSPDTEYTFTVRVFDELGNGGLSANTDDNTKSSSKSVTFTTLATALKKIIGTVGANQDIAEQIFAMGTASSTVPDFTIIDENDQVIAKDVAGMDIKYVVIENHSEIVNTTGLQTVATPGFDNPMPYETDGTFVFDTGKTGTAVIRIQATYKGSTVLGHYGISVYNSQLTVQAWVGNTDYGTKTGTTGNLKSLINDAVTDGDDNDYLTVTKVSINGTIDTRDLRVLREMGGVIFNNTYNSKNFTNEQMAEMPYYCEIGNANEINHYRGNHGVITDAQDAHGAMTEMDLANATFTVAPDNDNIIVTLPVNENNTYVRYDWENTGNLYNINQFAFIGCSNLEKVTLPDHPSLYIGQHAFEYCENLQYVKNLDKVTWFDANCFNQDKNLVGDPNHDNKVLFSNDCKRIGYVAFQKCEKMKLANRHLPDAIDFIGDQAFADCYGLDSYIVFPNNPSLDVAHIASGVFMGCKNLKLVYIPSTTVTLGYQAFEGCSELQQVIFYDSATPEFVTDAVAAEKPTDINGTLTESNGTYTFTYDVTKSDYSLHLRNIIANAFARNYKLSSESIKAFHNVKLIGNAAFVDVKNLTDENLVTLLRYLKDSNDRDDKDAGGSKVINNGTNGVSNDSGLNESLLNYTLGSSVFQGCDALTTAVVPDHIIRIDEKAFANCNNLQTVTLGSGLTRMGDCVFFQDPKLNTINVTNPVAPTMDHPDLTYTQKEIIENEEKDVTHDSDIFFGSQENQIEVVFTDAMKTGNDASGYKTYRANAHFRNVMKRTMSDAATAYEVPAQFGADVTLNRTIGKGKWNTLVLPFGLSNNAGRTDHTANVLKTALGEGGKVAMYRGLNTDRNTFLFLLYEDENAIKPFLPVIVYTNADNISTLSFKDVDVNYFGETESTKVTAETLDGAAASSYGAYVGERDPKMEDTELGYFNGTDKSSYRFAGTFKTIYSVHYENAKVTAAEGSKIINAGDFIIQNNKFYEVTNPSADRRYTLKAFRGWFQKIPETPSGAKVATVEIAAFDGLDFGGETTEIVNVDLATGEEIKPQDIYSTDGRLVKRGATSTDGLAKGIYIIGGRKIVVK